MASSREQKFSEVKLHPGTELDVIEERKLTSMNRAIIVGNKLFVSPAIKSLLDSDSEAVIQSLRVLTMHRQEYKNMLNGLEEPARG